MIIPTIQLNINVCPLYWKDIKEIRKITKRKELRSSLDEDETSDVLRLKSIPYSEAILNTILNCFPDYLDNVSDKYDRQPLLQQGWIIRKMRYAIDNRGKSNGTRTILKNHCTDERKFEEEFMGRIKEYLCL